MNDFDHDEQPPRRTHHIHHTKGSLLAGFGHGFGGCLGVAFGIVVILGILIGGIAFFVKRANEEIIERGRTNQQAPADPPKTLKSGSPSSK